MFHETKVGQAGNLFELSLIKKYHNFRVNLSCSFLLKKICNQTEYALILQVRISKRNHPFIPNDTYFLFFYSRTKCCESGKQIIAR